MWFRSHPLKHGTVSGSDVSFYSFCTARVPIISKNQLVKPILILRDGIIIYETVAWSEYLWMSYKVRKIEVSSGNTDSLLSLMTQTTLVMILQKTVSMTKRMREK